MSMSFVTIKEYLKAYKKAVPLVKHARPRSKSKEAAVYTITTLSSRWGQTTPAICSSFEKAEELLGNYGDMYENGYGFVVIEPVLLDMVYGIGLHKAFWYFWDQEKSAYAPCKPPAFAKGIVGWSAG